MYASNLIASADNKEKHADLLRRIQGLVEEVPQAKSPSLEVMLLQADYQRAENLAGSWLSAPDNTSARDEAAAILDRIAPQLDQRQQQLQAELDRLLGEMEELKEGDARRVKENEVARLKSVAGRAAYFAAWSSYYLARVRPDSPQAKAALVRARDVFLGILGIDGDYQGLDGEMLGLESIWRARALIGLGLSEAAVGNLEGSRACFDLLERPSVSSEVREQAPYWRLESLLSAGQYAAALQFAKERIEAFSGSPTQAKVSFCVSLVRAARPQPEAPPEARQLGALGIAGLVKLRQTRALQELIDKYQIALDGASGFSCVGLAASSCSRKPSAASRRTTIERRPRSCPQRLPPTKPSRIWERPRSAALFSAGAGIGSSVSRKRLGLLSKPFPDCRRARTATPRKPLGWLLCPTRRWLRRSPVMSRRPPTC